MASPSVVGNFTLARMVPLWGHAGLCCRHSQQDGGMMERRGAKRLTTTSWWYRSGNLLVLMDNSGQVLWFGVGYIDAK